MKKYIFSFLVIFSFILSSCDIAKPEMMTVKLFYYNQALDTNQSCGEQFVIPIERSIPKDTANIIQKTLTLLLE
jgi:hypothetical protein